MRKEPEGLTKLREKIAEEVKDKPVIRQASDYSKSFATFLAEEEEARRQVKESNPMITFFVVYREEQFNVMTPRGIERGLTLEKEHGVFATKEEAINFISKELYVDAPYFGVSTSRFHIREVYELKGVTEI